MAPELRALIDGSRDAVRRVIADLREKAETAEQLRSAEHRAFMAEQREAMGLMLRATETKLAEVRDGTPGRDGINGADGAPGRDGADGQDGAPGRDGADGAPGVDGRDGVDGQNGVAGADGARGEIGPQGEPGRDGRDGAPGSDGRDGVDGAAGINGRDGADGKDGADGAPGRDGLDGKDGEPGAQGEAGRDGVDGKDAYPGEARGLFDPAATYRSMDVVSFNGSEWRAKRDDPGDLPGDGWMLSASRGKRGDRGERGLQGERGIGGADGASLIAAFVDDSMQLTLTRDDGVEIQADLYPLAETVRSVAVRDADHR